MRPIHSIEDLREAKRDLARKRKASKVAFANHLGALRQDATGFVVKKVALPVGLGLVAAFAIKFLFFDKKEENVAAATAGQTQRSEAVKEDSHKSSWLNYFSILLSIIKIYQSAVAQNQAKEAREEDRDVSEEQNRDNAPEPEKAQEEPAFSPKSFVAQYQQQKGEQ